MEGYVLKWYAQELAFDPRPRRWPHNGQIRLPWAKLTYERGNGGTTEWRLAPAHGQVQ
jgi:hypothetical protein